MDQKVKAPVTARELIEFAAPKAAEMFEKTGELRAIWHIVCANGEHGIVGAPMGNGFQKDIVAAAMREVFKNVDAVAVVYMCESWVRMDVGVTDADVEQAWRDGIHNDPLRQECLWFSAEDAEGQITAYQMIERPDGPDGPGRLQPLKWLDKLSRMEGRFVGMLPTKGRGH
jgi:hypothetical protein